MIRRYWKNLRPTSLPRAIEACIDFARENKNASVDRIADWMGLNSKFTLYKWIANGRIPAVEIPAFEHACGCTYITDYLGHAAHKLLIDIPTGRGNTDDVAALQSACAEAVSSISRFHRGQANAEQTLGRIRDAMSHLAFHHVDVEKAQQPELEFAADE